jgi:amino-acid N-acetyltransferase
MLMQEIQYRFADPSDRAGIENLLRSNELPVDDLGDHFEHFMVAVLDGDLVGCAGLEFAGKVGLFRSLAVEPRQRGRGIATALCAKVGDHALRLGVRDLYLLTTGAEGFFSRLGFDRIDRDNLPETVRATREFRFLCPATAVGMMRRIRGPIRPSFDRQVESFHRVFTDLVRMYQFRDRQELAGHGLTVSQCHALEVLGDDRVVRMGALASRLNLPESTTTRIVDQLVAKDLASRQSDGRDRRVCCVGLSRKGKALYRRIRTGLLAREKEFLRSMTGSGRQALIDGLEELSGTVDSWRAGCNEGGRNDGREH